ncbi:hypothetical protein F5051DRAFT_447481 [Lentinula edodes]|nr:hypothetical protein F5051DRAFT_447481 [Lentinula edodes]
MASTSSQTRSSASSTLLPYSLSEAQELVAGLKSKSSLPLFFESALFQRLSEGDYSPPILDSSNSPDHDTTKALPAFSYPRPLVPFCFLPNSSRPMSVASGLDLFCSSRMIIHLLQPVMAVSSVPDSGKVYALFEEAAPFLIYIRDFWIGQANCPLFAEHVLCTAAFLSQKLPAFFYDSLNHQWGVPLEDRSSFLSSEDLKHFPSIPIPFCLRFREGSAIMRLVPLEDLDPFSALRSSKTETRPLPGGTQASPPAEDSTESSKENQSVSPPKSNKRKRELWIDVPNVKSPSKEDRPVLPKASSSKKKVEKPAPKPKATARSKTSVKMVEESRVSPESEELATPSYQIKRVRLPPRLRQAAKGKARQMEVLDVEESETEEEVVPPPSKCLKSSKSAPAPPKASNFRPALLIDEQGRLKLPGDSVEGFTPFKRIEHARNSAPLQRQNPIFDVNPNDTPKFWLDVYIVNCDIFTYRFVSRGL